MTIHKYFNTSPADVPERALADWAEAVLETVASGEDLAALCFDSGEAEAAYPDALAFTLPELTLSADCSDSWGSVLSTFFPLCGALDAIGYYFSSPVQTFSVPASWGYSYGAAGNTWESAAIPGEDAFDRFALVARTAIHDADASGLFDQWCVEPDEASAALDMAILLSGFSGAVLGSFPDPEQFPEVWEAALTVLLASGHCLNYAADNIQRAGYDY